VGVDVPRWVPRSSKSVGGREQRASVGSTPIHSRPRSRPVTWSSFSHSPFVHHLPQTERINLPFQRLRFKLLYYLTRPTANRQTIGPQRLDINRRAQVSHPTLFNRQFDFTEYQGQEAFTPFQKTLTNHRNRL
jgi:hypothetical protein